MLVPARAVVGALALAALGATALPGQAAVSPTAVTYAHCGSAAKAVVQGVTTYAMDATKPATSFTANGGCGTLDSDKRDDDGIVLTGSYTGNLDVLTVDAHVIDAGPVRAGAYGEIYVDAVVTVDGVDVAAGEVHLVPVASSTGLSRLLQFSVRGIGLTDEDEAGKHDIRVALNTSSYLDGDQLAWVVDAAEVPTGVTYSPAQLAAVVVDVPPAEGEE